MNASGEPITKCPVCRYDLTGLPKNHTCPECGFEYDETMRIWLGPKPGWTLAILSSVPTILLLGMLFYAGIKARTPMPAYVYAMFCSGGLLVSCIILVITVLERRTSSFMIVSHKGLYLKGVRQLRFTPWNELSVPPPSDLWLRRPIESAPVSRKQRFRSWLSLRVLTRDLGGFNFHRTIFKKGEWQKPLRLQFGSCNAKTRRAAYEDIYKRWSGASIPDVLKLDTEPPVPDKQSYA